VQFLASLAGSFFKAILGAVLDLIKQRQTRADEIGLGQQQQMTTYAVTALQVQDRMREAAVQPHDVAAATEALNAGTF
jgi:hypothetical protein